MTNQTEKIELSNAFKIKQPLTGKQKMMFTLFCWGVHSWGQARNFKTNGYDQKHVEAMNALRNGLVIYGVNISLFVLMILFWK